MGRDIKTTAIAPDGYLRANGKKLEE